ncbi:hypothetical protein GH714_037890 [Hevea brasiliensis]|uniref:CCHC-type domain-containing protein n=1 Tax=Hevea brasiliensis TaxID=3981 RepID=A0A6A6K8E0_HEVBR|nr:hypothetical protein GH714_037890 [Hevea brasiliensis]
MMIQAMMRMDLRCSALQGQKGAGQNFQQNYRRNDEFKLKMDIPTFNGNLDIEGFLDWKLDGEKGAIRHFMEENATIVEGKVPTSYYEQYLYESCQNCSQGTHSVNEYITEFLRLAARNHLAESDSQQAARHGDNKFATEKEKGKTTQGASSSCGTNAKKSNNKALTVGGSKGANSNAPKASNPYAKPIVIKCFRCNKIGHLSNKSPKRKSVNIVGRELEDEKEEFCGPAGDDVEKNMSKRKEFMW